MSILPVPIITDAEACGTALVSPGHVYHLLGGFSHATSPVSGDCGPLLVILLSHAAGMLRGPRNRWPPTRCGPRNDSSWNWPAAIVHGELTGWINTGSSCMPRRYCRRKTFRGWSGRWISLASKSQSARCRRRLPAAEMRAELASYSTTPSPPAADRPSLPSRASRCPRCRATPVPSGNPGARDCRPDLGGDAMFTDCEAGLLGGEGSHERQPQFRLAPNLEQPQPLQRGRRLQGPHRSVVPNGNFGVGFGINVAFR